jgi:hypothetical protein
LSVHAEFSFWVNYCFWVARRFQRCATQNQLRHPKSNSISSLSAAREGVFGYESTRGEDLRQKMAF